MTRSRGPADRTPPGGPPPDLAVVLGSGLLGEIPGAVVESVVPYGDLEGFPAPTVPGHRGERIVARRGGRRVLLFAGRFHLYEGAGFAGATVLARNAREAGAVRLLVTNAAGGLDPDLPPGALLLAEEFVDPLLSEARATRFSPDALPPARPREPRGLARLVEEAALEAGIPLGRGVLGWARGPSYETAAELAILRAAGARAVTMSSVPEWTEAVRLGMDAAVLSVVTNTAVGPRPKLAHEEVLRNAEEASRAVGLLLACLLDALPAVSGPAAPPASSAGRARARLEGPPSPDGRSLPCPG